MRCAVASVLALSAFVFAGFGLAASSFSDAPSDNNEAPDVVSVTVSQPGEGVVSVSVAIDNFTSLPENSWINLWFDLDSDQSTGAAGDEALVRYTSDGALQYFLWNGSQLVAQPVTGMTASYTAGMLSLAAPVSALDGASTFGLLAVASRGQAVGGNQFIASDFAPDTGRSAYVGPAEMDFSDPGEDHDGAPDLTSIRVTDAKNGWVSFAISTPNYAQLPVDTGLALVLDRDNRTSTGDDGAEISITTAGGELVLERWDQRSRRWVLEDPPNRVRVRNSDSVVTIDVHRSELENTPRFGFAVVAADLDARAETILGLDVAPDEGRFYRYQLANKPGVLLTATKMFGTPARPRAGKPFTVSLAVRRSDTNKGVTSGAVACRVRVAGKKVPATGSISGGAGRCRVVVPKTAAGTVLRGTITVRTGGKSITADFAFPVR